MLIEVGTLNHELILLLSLTLFECALVVVFKSPLVVEEFAQDLIARTLLQFFAAVSVDQ